MTNILILGNPTKDIYLSLSPTDNPFEQDHATPWLDLPFDGSTTRFFHSTTISAGAAITKEVLTNFRLQASLDTTDPTLRIILTSGPSTHYLRPTTLPPTTFTPPKTPPDLIFIDRSATLSPELSSRLLTYLSLATDTQLALFISRHTDTAKDFVQSLIKKSTLTFSDTSHLANYQITSTSIASKDHSISWSLSEKQNIHTDLTTSSIIAATLLAAHLTDISPPEALLLAKFNVENSTLSGTLPLSTLKEMTANQSWQVKSQENLRATTQKLLTQGKGILAADESGGSIHKKFESMSIPDDEQHRRDYRNIFFTTEGLERYVSGAILFDETARQHADDGTDFPTFLSRRSVIPGIKVDQGLDPQPSGETLTKGLDNLPARLAEYYNMGLRFAKWRAAFTLTPTTPTAQNIKQNCDILAQYAKSCQLAGLVPIVEPELVYDGGYSIEQSADTTAKILSSLIESLNSHQVNLKTAIVKTNMVLAGKKQPHQSTPEEVGIATAQVLRTSLPDDLAGVVFLSGGQSVTQATENLQAITNQGPFPWPVTFSFARALQDPALEAWRGHNENADAARAAFLSRLIANQKALEKS